VPIETKRNAATQQKPVVDRSDPLWYKDAIIYQTHVKSFFDSNNDGIGDFAGLTDKLDYIKDLGVSAIWLLPFYPSPLRDDGYDIADYRSINPSYGDDARRQAVRRRGAPARLRVITELVINHTSDQHPWFQRARRAKRGSGAYRDYYVWSDTDQKYSGTRIIFLDTEPSNWSWDPVAQGLLLAPLLQPPARSQLRQSAGAARRCSIVMHFWLTWASTACGSMPSPI
jgi:maltose alpha-D-glucosyltransferase / alpha-amylase